MLVVVLGGARSGKSALAVRWASAAGQPVTFVATAEAGDAEMARRIAHHRAERPPSWATEESPLDLSGPLQRVTAPATVVIDCLTLWVANVTAAGWDEETVVKAAAQTAAAAARRPGLVLAVSNEVGSGIVPASASVRRYRDLLGRVNAVFAGAAHHAYLVVAGLVLPLGPAPDRVGV
jgi:adenosylcobinamide kinase / adenosylcobinamide-phosphate guanylyltransferase